MSPTPRHRTVTIQAALAVLVSVAVALPAALAHAQAKEKRPGSSATAAPAKPAPAAEAVPADGDVADEAVVAMPIEPPKPGYVHIDADDEGLVAEVAGEVHGLKKGDNRYELPAGVAGVRIKDKAGKVLLDKSVDVPAGGDVTLVVKTLGRIVVQSADDAKVTLDGKAVDRKAAAAGISVAPGEHAVQVSRPGYFGRKGKLNVAVGQTATVDPTLEAFVAGSSSTLAWAGIIGGGALVVTGVLVDAFADWDSVGGEGARWGLLGVGAAAFVVGNIMLKNQMDEAANPPMRDGGLKVQVGALQGGAMAVVAGRF